MYPLKQRFTGLRPHEHPVFFGEDHAVEGEAERREKAQPRSLLVPPLVFTPTVAEVARTGAGGVAQNRSGARRIGSELLRAFGPGPARAR